jgi:multicomponent Na+:H+ antiporter subunit D
LIDERTFPDIPFAAYAVLVSLAAVPLILLSSRFPNLREGISLAAAVVKFVLVLLVLAAVRGGERLVVDLVEIAPGIGLSPGR